MINETKENPQTSGEMQRYRDGHEAGYNMGLKACLAEIKRLRDTVKEYANENNWKAGVLSGDTMVSWAEIDRGKKARSAMWSHDFNSEKVDG